MSRSSAECLVSEPGPADLETALRYAIAAAALATPETLTGPTPCREWDLRALLTHASDSADAVTDGLTGGQIDLIQADDSSVLAADPAHVFCDKASALLAFCADVPRSAMDCKSGDLVAIGNLPMPVALLVATGTLEMAVHGWDIFQAAGQYRPIPHRLALGLLDVAPALLAASGRYPMFAAAVGVRSSADPSERLTAYLGRSPLTPDLRR